MKIRINTEDKSLNIEGNYTVGEIIKELKVLLPESYKDYTLLQPIEYINAGVIYNPTITTPYTGTPYTGNPYTLTANYPDIN